MRIKILRWLILVSVLFSMVGMSSTPSHAEQLQKTELLSPAEGKGCNSLDVIFLIDQSGSMSGADTYIQNDPTGQRKYAVDWAIDWLADNAWDICVDAVHRISVISFGTFAEVDLEMAVINPETRGEWEYIRSELKESIELRDMDYTNPFAAFILAKQLFDSYSPPEGIVPKRVIVFMTDGQPDPKAGTIRYLEYVQLLKKWIDGELEEYEEDIIQKLYLVGENNDVSVEGKLPENWWEGLTFDPTLLELEKCLDEERAIAEQEGENINPIKINECFAENPVTDENFLTSTYIFTMLLSNNSSWPDIIKNEFRNISLEHGGDMYEIIENRVEIPGTFLDIFTELSGVEVTTVKCNDFVVNPFTKQARITIFKVDPDKDVEISYTDAQTGDYSLTTTDLSSPGFNVIEHIAGTNERFVLADPYPGVWRINTQNCEEISAYYETVEIDVSPGLNPVRLWNEDQDYFLPEQLELPEFDEAPFFNEDSMYFLTYELNDVEGNVLGEIPNKNIVVKAEAIVTLPDASTETYAMQWDESLQKFRTIDPLKLPMPGNYTFLMKGEVPYREWPFSLEDDENSQDYQDVFGGTLPLFDVSELSFNVFEVLPIKPQVEVEDSTIHNTLLQNGFSWPLSLNPIKVSVYFVDENEQEIESVDEIFTNPEAAVSAYWEHDGTPSEPVLLQKDPNSPGRLTGELPLCEREGEIKISFAAVGDYQAQFRFLKKDADLNMTRADTLWTNPMTYIVLLGILIFIVVVLIIRCIVNSRHPVNGILKLSAAGGEPDEFYLKGKLCQKNKAVITKELLPTQEYSDLYRIEVRSVPKVKLATSHEEDYEDVSMGTFGMDSLSSNPYTSDDLSIEKDEVKVRLWLISQQKPIQKFFPGKPDVEMNLVTGEQRPYSDMAATEIRLD